MSGLIKAACPSNITQLQINKVKVTWYPTNEEHWLQTNLSLTAFDFQSIPAQVISNHNPHQRARARHRSKSSVDSRSLSPHPPQLFERSSTSETFGLHLFLSHLALAKVTFTA